MSITTLIIGSSGTGKSTSIETLDPKETFVINTLGKPLPFRGYAKLYRPSSNGAMEGNFFSGDDPRVITKIIEAVSSKRMDIKNIVLDDAHYIMANEYFRRADEKGYNKFSEIGANTFRILDALKNARDDILVWIMWHPEREDDGNYKCKTIGKSLDQKFGIEGVAIHILYTKVVDGNYFFLTNHDGVFPAKTPKGLFSERHIPNDLQLVRDKILDYYFQDVEM